MCWEENYFDLLVTMTYNDKFISIYKIDILTLTIFWTSWGPMSGGIYLLKVNLS